jgi:DNA modification methylase
LKSILKFDTKNALCLPLKFQNDDVRFSDSFAEYFIGCFSKPGDIVFDPFAGYGTTLYAAERLGRRAFGMEYLPERVDFIKTNLNFSENILCGNALKLHEIKIPRIDFVLTSPPYMQKINHPEYPFAGYEITGQGYGDYLSDIVKIFKQVKAKLKIEGYAVVEVGNLLIDDIFTPLAWDIARAIGSVLSFKQEIIIDWQRDTVPAYGFGYDHSYALIFQNTSVII